MEQQEIIEGNKLIANFMGDQKLPGDKNGDMTTVAWMSKDRLEYHSSWDWIMPVVSKIRALLDKDSDNYKELKSRWQPIANELQNFNLENVWFCVVKFIEWQNS